MLTHVEEETLSYFQGLAPVGETFETPLAWVLPDLGVRSRHAFYRRLNALISKGYVRRIACGAKKTSGVLMVLRRLEADAALYWRAW